MVVMDPALLLEPFTRHSVLLEHEAKSVFRSAGIRVPEGIWIPAGAHMSGPVPLRYPLAAKVSSRAFSSKSGVRGVRLGICDRDGLGKALDELQRIPDAEGVLVEEMAEPGVEAIVGGAVDPQFGPIVMFGLGGIFTEVFRDVSFGLAPLDRERAFAAVRQITGYQVLEEYRGRPAVDREALARVMVTVSEFMATGLVEEIDLNPVALSADGAVVLDAKIKLLQR
ncbi:MAG: hypothetical protein OHK006_02810 [Thermodesulfovibrionales bacterium]